MADTKGIGDRDTVFECPYCQKTFRHKKGLDKHINWSCKKVPSSEPETVSGPRVVRPPQAPVVQVRVDHELNHLLAGVESEYVRWRVAQKLGICQESTFPVLFDYRFPGSKKSPISKVCPTSDPIEVMRSVLKDAHERFKVDKVSMPKLVSITDLDDGSSVDVSKWLRPAQRKLTTKHARPSTPGINVEETDESYIYSLDDIALSDEVTGEKEVELEDSLRSMDISRDFDPPYQSSPAPRNSLFGVASQATKGGSEVAGEVTEEGDKMSEGVENQNLSEMSTLFFLYKNMTYKNMRLRMSKN